MAVRLAAHIVFSNRNFKFPSIRDGKIQCSHIVGRIFCKAGFEGLKWLAAANSRNEGDAFLVPPAARFADVGPPF